MCYLQLFGIVKERNFLLNTPDQMKTYRKYQYGSNTQKYYIKVSYHGHEMLDFNFHIAKVNEHSLFRIQLQRFSN